MLYRIKEIHHKRIEKTNDMGFTDIFKESR